MENRLSPAVENDGYALERCTCGRSAVEFDALERDGSLVAIATFVATCKARGYCAAREIARTAINSGIYN